MFTHVYDYKIYNYVNRTILDVYTAIASLNTPLHFGNQIWKKLVTSAMSDSLSCLSIIFLRDEK